jgi:ABC-type amino acid transport substrate-binding protein
MLDRANERAFMSEVSAVVERDVRVGTDDAPPVPMQLGNPETADFRGYEVDLLGEVDLICRLLCAQVVTLASRVFMKSKIA